MTKEEACKFAEWCAMYYTKLGANHWLGIEWNEYTTKQLLEIYESSN